MISDQINHLIEQVKQHKNGESRNSLLGRLKDARAHAIVLEREEFMTSDIPSNVRNNMDDMFNNECICPAPGVIDSSCLARVHKLS